ncbi:MAG: hypothetical protein AMXMBFR83_01620 [Phycisphaerae bacterium]
MTTRTRCAFAGFVLVGLCAAAPVDAAVSLAWKDPGWTYEFTGNAASPGVSQAGALDGAWDHDNGSDSWDQSDIGTGAPGGVSALSSGSTNYIRIQDPGDPRQYNMPDPSNRKIYLTRNITADGASNTILNDGVTITFRARVATGSPLDNAYPASPVGVVPWPAGGRGYGIHDGGKGNFGIKQGTGSNGNISFSLVMPGDNAESGTTGGLLMNHLNGGSVTANVDTTEAGTVNRLDLVNPTEWHEFWITIVGDTSGGGTHRVNVYVDGALTPTTFHVTAGNGNDEGYSYMGLGMGSTNFYGAVDVDFFAYKPGVIAPLPLGACASDVSPAGTTTFTTDVNQQPSPSFVDLVVSNPGEVPFNYTAVELDAAQQANGVPWMSLNKSGGSVGVGGSDTVRVTVDATGLADGLYEAYVRFTDNCNPANVHVRKIELNVLGCRWTVDSCSAVRGFLHDFPNAPIQDVVYTIANAAATPVGYSTAVSYSDPGCTGWVSLTNGSGTLAQGQAAQLTAGIDEAALAACAPGGVYNATLTIDDDCGRQQVTRTITVRSVAVNSVGSLLYNGDVDPLSANSAGPGLSFALWNDGSVQQGAVETDPAAQDFKAWHMVDSSSVKTKYNSCVFTGTNCVPPTVFNEVGATVVGRLKVAGWATTREMMLGIDDTGGLHTSVHWGGSDGVVREVRRGVETATGSATADYVIARATAVGVFAGGYECGRHVRIYLNEDPAPVLDLVLPSSQNSESDGIGFGVGSTGGTADVWFDWVSGTNAGAFAPGEEVAVLGKSLVPPPPAACASAVQPSTDAAFTADVNEAASPAGVSYTIINPRSTPLNYTVTKLDENQQPNPVPWLVLSKTGGPLAPNGGSDVVTVSINTAGLTDGLYTGYVRFADDCNPANVHVRKVTVDVFGCRWTVDSCNAIRGFLHDYPAAPIEDVVYTVANAAATTVGYDVAVSYSDPSCSGWISLTNASGSIPQSQAVQVTADLNESVLASCTAGGAYSATLNFSDTCGRTAFSRTITVRSVPAGQTRIWSYHGNVAPLSPGSAGTNLSFHMFEGVSQGEVIDDPAADDRLAWHIADSDTAKSKFASCVFDGANCVAPTVFNEVGATVVGRLRVSGFTDPREMVLAIYDPDGLHASFHWGGPDGVIRELRRGVETAITGTPGYVVLRAAAVGVGTTGYACAREIKVYVNESPVPTLELLVAGASSNDAAFQGIGFGAGSTAGTMDVTFDWVAGTNAGAFAPGEEVPVLGRSLIPSACNDPFADVDGDGDVDQRDFARWQLCFTGPNATFTDFARCGCLDATKDERIDENDLLPFVNCISGPNVPADPECDGD